MKISRSLLRALNVRKDEWWLVQKLFLLQFFQGAGIAFFFTSAFSRFLEHFPVADLAYVYILSSLLLWVTGFIYSRLEHRLSPTRLSFLITLVLAASMVLFRAGAAYIPGNWFFFLMLAWFNVLYLLNNLMFWGMASQLYDVRQSKRLFGVISAGDIPAKFIGYSVALLIVSYTGTANLLLAGFLCILLSFPFLKNVLEAGKTGKIHTPHTPKPVGGVQILVKDFTVNVLVRRVAVLSLVVSACIILINYGFYAEVKHAYKNDVEFARFIAFFLAMARLIALVIKMLFTSRLLYWLGNRIALIITPVLLLAFIITLLVTKTMTYEHKTVLYIFGLTAIAVDVLRSAINSPVLLTMMQPLSLVERLRAHNIVKGIMDPFAYLFAGVFLLLFSQLRWYNLETLCYVLLGLALAWIIGVFRVHHQYLKTLIKTISSRYFSQEDFSLNDTATREMIEEKINTGSELEVLYILKMLGSRGGIESKRLIIHALHHPSVNVTREALRLISELHIKEAETWLSAIIEKHPVDDIRSKAIKVLGEIGFNDDIMVPLMESDDKLIRNSAIVSVMNHSKVTQYKNEGERKIKALLTAGNSEDKIEAAGTVRELVTGNFDDELLHLFNEKDPELQRAGIRAMGYHPSPGSLALLIQAMDSHEKDAIEALIIARDKSLPFIKNRVLEISCPVKQKELLLNAIGRIGGKTAYAILLSLVNELHGYQPHCIRVLHRCHFKAPKKDQPFIETLIRDQLIYAASVLHMQKKLLSQNESYRVLAGSLQLELNAIRDTLLYLFSFIYDREKISRVKAAIEINKKETNANAIELVDMTVKKEFANPFNAAFEQGDLEHRCALLKNLFPKNLFPDLDAILAAILDDKKSVYNTWTKTCSLYILKKLEHRIEVQLIHKYLQSENPLLKETAGYALGIN